NQATPTCSVTGYAVTYDFNAHIATGTCTGVSGETLAGLDLSGTIHLNAGPYSSDQWAFTDFTGNYQTRIGIVADTITKAVVHVDATRASKVYGQPDPPASGTLRAADFRGLDTATTSGITGTANCTIGSHSPSAGTYLGVVSCGPGTLSSPNYTFAAGAAAN